MPVPQIRKEIGEVIQPIPHEQIFDRNGIVGLTRVFERFVEQVDVPEPEIAEQIVPLPVPRIREETVEMIKRIPQERIIDHTVEQIVDPHVQQIREQTVEVMKVIPKERGQRAECRNARLTDPGESW